MYYTQKTYLKRKLVLLNNNILIMIISTNRVITIELIQLEILLADQITCNVSNELKGKSVSCSWPAYSYLYSSKKTGSAFFNKRKNLKINLLKIEYTFTLAHEGITTTTPTWQVGIKAVKGCTQHSMSNHFPVGNKNNRFSKKQNKYVTLMTKFVILQKAKKKHVSNKPLTK